ncbi:hypothetical protein CORC01_00487 [Colletotrichum orchidophilum]|uniref:Uncharacterized protein n=1 Tax=Colletotrichum orchidophilum TaxID=1209926 RepID=A0A1G4BRX0_9PEZI|nr:uncharacterized protein CORC01_00487 [Colletotrichum orchidophilum]OHF04148.1 hypothetical protein CORC01_00487 [Colletotrichum orchidophilum]
MTYSHFPIMISRFFLVGGQLHFFFLWLALIHSVDFDLVCVRVSPPSSQLIWILVFCTSLFVSSLISSLIIYDFLFQFATRFAIERFRGYCRQRFRK